MFMSQSDIFRMIRRQATERNSGGKISVVLHRCTIEDECFIGIGSIMLDGCKVGKGSVAAAGAVLPPGFEVPPESVVMGSPAKIKKKTRDSEAGNDPFQAS